MVSSHVEMRLTTQPRLGLLPVGYLDANPPPEEMVPERTAPVLGTPDDLERVVSETGARHVVFGFLSGPDSEVLPHDAPLRGARACRSRSCRASSRA